MLFVAFCAVLEPLRFKEIQLIELVEVRRQPEQMNMLAHLPLALRDNHHRERANPVTVFSGCELLALSH